MIWAPLAATGPESARSAELLVAGQRTVIARGLAGEARAQAPSVAQGTHLHTLLLHTGADGTGPVVARVDGEVHVGAEPWPAWTNVQNATTLDVRPQDVFLGERRVLPCHPMNAVKQVVAIAPGALTWSVVHGGDRLRLHDGVPSEVEGLAPGSAAVRAVLGEVESSPLALSIVEGATLGAEGGLVATADGAVRLTVPRGALPGPTRVRLDRAVSIPPNPDLVTGSTVDLSPDGLAFNGVAELSIAFDPDRLPTGVQPANLRVAKLVEGAWQPLTSRVDSAQRRVAADLSGFSVYGLVAQAVSSGPTVYVVDTIPPGSSDHFTELEPAIAALLPRLNEEATGTVEVRTNRTLRFTRLVLSKSVRIVPGEGYRVRLGGTTGSPVVEAPVGAVLTGWTCDTGVAILASASVTLRDCAFAGPVAVQFPSPGPVRARPAANPVGALVSELVAPSLSFDGLFNGPLVTETSTIGDLNLALTADAGADIDLRNLTLNRLDQNLTLRHETELTLDNVNSDTGILGFRGSAKARLVGTATGIRNLTTTLDTEVEGELTHGTFDFFRVQLERGGLLTGRLDGCEVGGDFEFLGATGRADAACELMVQGGRYQDVRVDAESTAGLSLLWDDAEFQGEAQAVLRHRDRHSYANLKGKGSFLWRVTDALSLGLGGEVSGVHAHNSRMADATLLLNDPDGLGEGSARFSLNKFEKRLDVAYSVHFSPRPRRKVAANDHIEIVDNEFLPTNGPESRIYVETAAANIEQVLIENNIVPASGALAIVVNEVHAPVTIKGNTVTGMIAVDGDLEGGGTTGPVSEPCLIENNQVHGSTVYAIAVQDLTQCTLRGNTASGGQGLGISDGRYTLEDNTLTAGLGLMGLAASEGKTTAVIVRGGQATGSGFTGVAIPANCFVKVEGVALQNVWFTAAGGYLWFTGNSCAGVKIFDTTEGGGLPVKPSGSGLDNDADVSSRIDFSGNGCADYPASLDSRDEDNRCRSGDGIPPPAVNFP